MMDIHWREWRGRPEPQDKRIVVFGAERYDGDWPPENASEFIAWFEDKIASVPEEHRSAIKIDLDSESGYEGSHYASIEITYWRKETPEEVAARLAEWEVAKEQHLAQARAEYERLKAAFG